MPVGYIVAIVCGSVFVVLLVANLIVYLLNVKKEALTRERLEKMYADKNLAEMKYDLVSSDEDAEELLSGTAAEGEITPAETPDASFNQLVIEGLEEITGDYKPE